MILCPACGARNSLGSQYCRRCNWCFNTKSYHNELCPRCKKPLLHPDAPCPFCSEIPPGQEKICSNCQKLYLIPLWKIHELSLRDRLLLNIEPKDSICEECSESLKSKARIKDVFYRNKFRQILNEMPILTLDKPINLTVIKYCDLISSQCLIEKNLFQKLSLKDYYENKDFSLKVESKELECIKMLKKNALKVGANTVLGVNFNYSELKCKNTPFLITAIGTGVIVEEFNILSDHEQQIYKEVVNLL